MGSLITFHIAVVKDLHVTTLVWRKECMFFQKITKQTSNEIFSCFVTIFFRFEVVFTSPCLGKFSQAKDVLKLKSQVSIISNQRSAFLAD